MSPGIQDTFKRHNNLPGKDIAKLVFIIDVAIVRNNVQDFIDSWESTGKWCIEKGIQYYAVDSLSQIEKILQASHKFAELGDRDVATVLAELNPFCRLVSSSKGSDKPFSNHFGAGEELVFEIIEKVKSGGLTFVGLSGYPGTQNLAKDAFVQFAHLFRDVFIDYNKTTMDAFSSAFAGWEIKLTI
ncbi:hypothetical protein FPRO04_12309 [Fusarium proliferatum]|nr:hypothetical protein FPRO04_12309 [Fusarium proliferatum]